MRKGQSVLRVLHHPQARIRQQLVELTHHAHRDEGAAVRVQQQRGHGDADELGCQVHRAQCGSGRQHAVRVAAGLLGFVPAMLIGVDGTFVEAHLHHMGRPGMHAIVFDDPLPRVQVLDAFAPVRTEADFRGNYYFEGIEEKQ